MIFIDKTMVLWEKKSMVLYRKLYGTLIYEIKKNRLQKNKKLKKKQLYSRIIEDFEQFIALEL